MTDPSRRQMSRLLKKITLKEGDIVLVKRSKFNDAEILDALRKGVESLGISKVFAIIVDDFEDIKTINQQEMNAYGWYNIEQINKVTRRI